jgi:hypothetical protein
MSDELSTSLARPERPGCVTAYAIFLWATAALGFFVGLCGLSSLIGAFGGGLGGFEIIIIGVVMVLLAINVVTGIGLWQMKKWGWALVVVIQGLNVVSQLLSMTVTLLTVVGAGGDFPAIQPSVLCGNLIGLLVSGFILYWFVSNRQLFNGGPAYKSVVGIDGELVQEPVKKTSDATMLLAVGGGLVLVFILICVVVVALLAIMGPQIGNVFSQITFELENPTTGIWPWLW